MQRIQIAQDYIAQLQLGNESKAEKLLQEINQLSLKDDEESSNKITQQKVCRPDEELYSKVGKLTRELHESISSFMGDTRVHMLTNEDMPDARQRLQYVVDLTEESAHKTMTLIEQSNPLLLQMQERANVLQQQLQNHNNNQCDDKKGNDPIYLNEEVDAFFHFILSSSKNIVDNLNEVMLAQNYQDLTGQIIQRVSTLVQEVENNLLKLLQTGSDDEKNEGIASDLVNEKIKKERNVNGYGPAIPGTDKNEVLQSQEEVDDLLSSLGF